MRKTPTPHPTERTRFFVRQEMKRVNAPARTHGLKREKEEPFPGRSRYGVTMAVRTPKGMKDRNRSAKGERLTRETERVRNALEKKVAAAIAAKARTSSPLMLLTLYQE